MAKKKPPFPIRDGYKFCHNCQRELPASPEYWSRCKAKTDGWDTQCKECRRNYHNANIDHAKQVQAIYRENHREKARLTTQQWRENNRERDRANASNWQRENRQKASERQAKWRSKHPDRVAASQRIYQKKHLQQHETYYHIRRARINKLPYDWNNDDWQQCLEYWGYKCCICGRQVGFWFTLAREHWIAIKDTRPDNPGTVPHNMLPMCHGKRDGWGGCNNSKSTLDPIVWLTKRLGKRKAKQKLAEIRAYFDKVRR